jgi:threonyl-tRNA synthetase
VRLRDGRRLPARSSDDVIARIRALIEAHDTRLWID